MPLLQIALLNLLCTYNLCSIETKAKHGSGWSSKIFPCRIRGYKTVRPDALSRGKDNAVSLTWKGNNRLCGEGYELPVSDTDAIRCSEALRRRSIPLPSQILSSYRMRSGTITVSGATIGSDTGVMISANTNRAK